MRGGGVHGQPLWCRVFACDHDVDVMAAAQAVAHHRQQAVGVGRKVNPHDERTSIAASPHIRKVSATRANCSALPKQKFCSTSPLDVIQTAQKFERASDVTCVGEM